MPHPTKKAPTSRVAENKAKVRKRDLNRIIVLLHFLRSVFAVVSTSYGMKYSENEKRKDSLDDSVVLVLLGRL